MVLLRVVGKVLLILTLEIRFVFFMMDLSPNNQIEDRKPILTADGLVQTSNSPSSRPYRRRRKHPTESAASAI